MAAITGKEIESGINKNKTGLTELEKKILKRLVPAAISSTDQTIKITRSEPESLTPSIDLSAVGGGGGITTLTGTEGVTVTGTGQARIISGKSLNDRVTAHGQAIAVNRNLANKNTSNLLKRTPGDEKITLIKEGSNVKFDYAADPTDNTRGTLTVNTTLKQLETGSGSPVKILHSGQNITFGYHDGDLTVNAVILELEDGSTTKKVIKKIKAGSNVSFALANDVLTVNSTGGGMTEAAFAEMFKKVVRASNPDLLRVIKIGSRITLNTEFSHNQIFSHRSTYSKTVFPDVSEIEISTAGRTDKEQYFIFKRKYTDQYLKLGFFQEGQSWKVGVEAQHMEHFFPGKGHAYSKISAFALDNHQTGFHTSYIRLAERKIRAGSEHQKIWTPTSGSAFVPRNEFDALKTKIARLEKLLKIKL